MSQEKFDAIVVGSGMGGLSVASLLAQEGKKVLVLEKHYKLGGYTHMFGRMGYMWDVGLHYVGQVHIEGTTLNKAFNYVTGGGVQWAPLDDAYDRVVIGEKEYDFVKGKENLKASLKEWFPAEVDGEAIDKYFALLDEVGRLSNGYYVEKVLPPFLSWLVGWFLRRPVLKYSRRTTLEVLRGLTSNEKLIGILTAQYGDYGMLPSKSSFYMHALLANHYMDGAGYPVGGSKKIADSVGEVVEKAGGELIMKANVEEVLVKGNEAYGVRLADGREFFGDKIISDTGVIDTFRRLVPEGVRKRHGLEEKVSGLERSPAHIGLYGGIRVGQDELKLPRCNYWVFPDEYDHEKGREQYKDVREDPPVVYISFPSAKDTSAHGEGKSTVEAIIIVPFEWFSKWEGRKWRERGEDYMQMKKEVGEKLLKRIYQVAPQLEGKMEYFEVSTPLSTIEFMNHDKGEMYGVAHGPKRFDSRFLKPYTPVKNFFLTGQDVMIASISGALMGGVLCASAILKKDVLKGIERA